MKGLVLGILFSTLLFSGIFGNPERCSLPVEKGLCQASIPNYYYNTDSGRCEQFMYSGCGGNGNRFMSMDDCIHSCSCQVKPDAGPCKAIKERWYYNPTRGCCEKFLYGGCQGNSNNFQSYEECNKMCSGSFTINLKPAGLNWGSMKVSSISGDRSMGGTFGKEFGGSRTVWLHTDKVPELEKGVLSMMAKSGGVALPGSRSSLQVVGREITGPGLVPSEKMSTSWSSGPIQTGVKRTVQVSSGGPVITGGMQLSGSSGTFMDQGMPQFDMNSLSGKTEGKISPGGLTVSRQGGIVSGGADGSLHSSGMGGGGLLSRGGMPNSGMGGGVLSSGMAGTSFGGGMNGKLLSGGFGGENENELFSGGGFARALSGSTGKNSPQNNPWMGNIVV